MESEVMNVATKGTTARLETAKGIPKDVQPVPEAVRRQNDHRQAQRRVFVGPMPERVVASASGNRGAKPRSRSDAAPSARRATQQGDDAMSTSSGTTEDVDQEHALAFFVAEGGREEDFERHERGIHEEIRRRLKESRWVPVLSKSESESRNVPSNQKWVGDTFEIGKDILGLPTINVERIDEAAIEGSSVPNTRQPRLVSQASGSNQTRARTTTTTTRATGRRVSFAIASPEDSEESHSSAQARATSSMRILPTTNTGTATLMQSSYEGDTHPPQDSDSAPSSPSTPASNSKASNSKTNLVRPPSLERSGAATRESHSERDAVQESPPAPPSEVLSREATEEPTTSAGAAAILQQDLQPPTEDTDVVMRDRMLVRILYSKQDGFARYMDETYLTETTDVKQEEWGEFIVAWRRGRIELYEDYTITAKEWFFKHKHLAFIIPLRPGFTKLSIFSPTDMSICLQCPPTPVRESRSRKWFHSRKTGTNLFLLRTKSRSRAVDWIWKLWRQLGGEIPDSITIRCPALEARVQFPIPAMDFATGSEGWHTFTRDRVIEDCRKQMSGIPDWDTLVEEPIRKGERLELCWRSGSKLDWVWLEQDEERRDRPWAVLWGVANANSRVKSDLELRIAEHSHTEFTLRDGTTWREPAALEGYLYRYRQDTHLRDPVYVATHDGDIFFIPTVSAHPPLPPTLPINATNPVPLPDPGQHATSVSVHSTTSAPRPTLTHAGEVARGAAQILTAKAFLDMRDIAEVRRAREPWLPVMRGTNLLVRKKHRSVGSQSQSQEAGRSAQPQASGSVQSTQNLPGADPIGGGGPLEDIRLDEEDRADAGGDEVLHGIADLGARSALKTRRSFELVLRSGEILRFEAYSCKAAVEWTVGLGSLISYWTRKQRVDARQEMDIVHAISGRTRYMVPKMGERGHSAYPAPPPDAREVSPLLGRLWHWCALENCRSIVRAGRLFVREGLRGEMKHFYFVLVSGHLVRFKLTASSAGLHERSSHARAINLLDAYVTSGHFAALGLAAEELDDSRAARRYQDGLETGDNDRDTLIVLRYRERAVEEPEGDHDTSSSGSVGVGNTKDVPRLNGEQKMLVLRARSKLERDEWCWALNVEIERLVRVHTVREAAVRQEGNVLPLGSPRFGSLRR